MNRLLRKSFERSEALDRVIAKRNVRLPGAALMVIGSLWILCSVAFAGCFVAFALPNWAGDGRGLARAFLFTASIIGFTGLAVGGLTVTGGYHLLLSLGSRRCARVGAVAATLTGIGGGCLFVVGAFTGAWALVALASPSLMVAGLPIGVWSFLATIDPLVKWAFR